MDDISDLAARWGVAAEYFDAFGNRKTVDRDVLGRIVGAISGGREPESRRLPSTVVLRGQNRRIEVPSDQPLRWRVLVAGGVVAEGTVDARAIVLPDLQLGTYHLHLSAADGNANETSTLLVAPQTTFQGRDPGACWWALAVQLYGIRSRRNWGIGDFTDLARLVSLAARVGAAGIALNPLHALFDDRPHQSSPYSPNSRLFLNPLYIDLDAVPEFPGAEAAGLNADIERLRQQDTVDYVGVAAAKLTGLRLAYQCFRDSGDPQRRAAFEAFRRERAPWLARYAAFEHLRRRFLNVWWEWPPEWRQPDEKRIAALRQEAGDEIEFVEFVQWLADSQLAQCCAKARELGLPIGLYMDVAVGVDAGGADAWSEPDGVLNSLSVGAPPDALNTAGQNWGLSGFSPSGLRRRQFEPFRQMLREAMRYAGAIRIDHVLGLRRMFVIPHGMKPQDGTYVQFPFEAMLAAVAQESVQQECIVIGEDLGTVPEGFREAMADWGLWSYLVLLFERRHDGSFRPPGEYKQNALASFNTHDLPTFAGWLSGHDRDVKLAIGIDPGESSEQRRDAIERLRTVVSERGSSALDFPAVAEFLAATPSRLVVLALEDALGLIEQPNLPGTVDEHPNWQRRLPLPLEDLFDDQRLIALGRVMANGGRGRAPGQ